MKAVLLAGGWGMRLREQTIIKPKPMVEIGHRPLLWHIMKLISHYGISEFIICVGYKGHLIKDFFANYHLYEAVVTFDMSDNSKTIHSQTAEPWKVTLVDTGLTTLTGGRLKKIKEFVGNDTFLMTYGDGVGDVDLNQLRNFHATHGRRATVTATRPPARFGALGIEEGRVTQMDEKPRGDGNWINGGFFLLEPEVLDLVDNDQTAWEIEPMQRLIAEEQLMAYQHDGFWQPMDTVRDMEYLEEVWQSGKAPWKVWD